MRLGPVRANSPWRREGDARGTREGGEGEVGVGGVFGWSAETGEKPLLCPSPCAVPRSLNRRRPGRAATGPTDEQHSDQSSDGRRASWERDSPNGLGSSQPPPATHHTLSPIPSPSPVVTHHHVQKRNVLCSRDHLPDQPPSRVREPERRWTRPPAER